VLRAHGHSGESTTRRRTAAGTVARAAAAALLLAAGAIPAAGLTREAVDKGSGAARAESTRGASSHAIVPSGWRGESRPRPGTRRETAPTPGLLAYDRTLRRYVRDGLVDYDGLSSDRADLVLYLKELASVDSTELRDRSVHDRMAFWINAYNALTLDLILRNLHGPDGKGPRLKSIRDIPDAFSRRRWVVAGARRSLDGIEKGILLEGFRDPRVHFALVCASRSCPALRGSAYVARSLAADLDSAQRLFLSDTSRNDLRVRSGAIRLSRIFNWYREDFIGSFPEMDPPPLASYPEEDRRYLILLIRFLPPETREAVQGGRVRIEFLPYDWSLNDATPRR
jgi:hypothetical protein